MSCFTLGQSCRHRNSLGLVDPKCHFLSSSSGGLLWPCGITAVMARAKNTWRDGACCRWGWEGGVGYFSGDLEWQAWSGLGGRLLWDLYKNLCGDLLPLNSLPFSTPAFPFGCFNDTLLAQGFVFRKPGTDCFCFCSVNFLPHFLFLPSCSGNEQLLAGCCWF
jgi:hypothetical protein